MARNIILLEHLPNVLKEIKDYQEISKIESPRINKMWEIIDRIIQNQFAETADEEAIKRYEKILGLTYEANASLEDRRFAVLAKYKTLRPYTFLRLNEILVDLIGEEDFELTRDVAQKTLSIRLMLPSDFQYAVIEKLLDAIVPANMIIKIYKMFVSFGVTRVGAISYSGQIVTIEPYSIDKVETQSVLDIGVAMYGGQVVTINP